MAASSSAVRLLSLSGSKVITDPGELDPHLLELLVERLSGRRLRHATIVPGTWIAAGERAMLAA
jgi:hypothetical protein